MIYKFVLLLLFACLCVRAHHLRSSIPSSLVSLFDVVVVVVVVVSTLAHRGSFLLGVSKKARVGARTTKFNSTNKQTNTNKN